MNPFTKLFIHSFTLASWTSRVYHQSTHSLITW